VDFVDLDLVPALGHLDLDVTQPIRPGAPDGVNHHLVAVRPADADPPGERAESERPAGREGECAVEGLFLPALCRGRDDCQDERQQSQRKAREAAKSDGAGHGHLPGAPPRACGGVDGGYVPKVDGHLCYSGRSVTSTIRRFPHVSGCNTAACLGE
jgi:hypothetical protein